MASNSWSRSKDNYPKGLLRFSFTFYPCVVQKPGPVLSINLENFQLMAAKTVLPTKLSLGKFDQV
jgi:hypothetical protein